jgi:DNA-binding XRE family transcriptional regulator
MGVQYITTEGGDELAVLPRAEYERLLDAIDDAVDLAALRERRGEPTMAHELAIAVIQGEMSPLEAWRREAGLTQAELAAKTGVRPATVSDIESGKSLGRVDVLRRIARVLRVDIDDLVPDALDASDGAGA